MNIRDESKRRFILNCLFWAALIALGWLFFRYVFNWILPFVVGFGFAAVADYFARRLLARFHMPLRLGSAIVTILILVLLGGVLFFLAYQIYHQLERFLYDRVINGNLLGQILDSVDKISDRIPEQLRTTVVNMIQQASVNLTTAVTTAFSGVLTAAPGILLGILIAIISSFIFSGDYRRITEFLKAQLPQKARDALPEVAASLKNSVLRFAKAYTLILFITFAELSIGLTILGEPYAIAIAAITAVIDILPILGFGIVLIPWILLSLINGRYAFAAGLVILYIIIQVVRQIIEPKLVGRSVGLHPILTLLSMYVGLKTLGAIGIFLFPIVLLLLKDMQAGGTVKIWNELPKQDPPPRRRGKKGGDPPTETKEPVTPDEN